MLGFRWLAFSCLVWAAFAWPTWWLDRTGMALLGAAFVALALGPRVVTARAAEGLGLGDLPTAGPDDAPFGVADIVARINAAAGTAPARQGWGEGVTPSPPDLHEA